MRAAITAETGVTALWILLLTLASMAATLALACAAPFASLAALAAVHMRRSDALALTLCVWAVSQLTGFLLLGFPFDGSTLAWGLGLGCAGVAAALGARTAAKLCAERGRWAALTGAYVAGFLAFKAVVLAFAFGLGGVAITLDPRYNAREFLVGAMVLAGLWWLHRAMIGLGLPPPARSPAIA